MNVLMCSLILLVIPERLLIFHAGTGRIVFVGALKVTTIFLFSATLFFIAPVLYNDPEQPSWVTPTGKSFNKALCAVLRLLEVVGASAVPLMYVMYYASPFVAYVHIKLPIFARRSREQLLKWAQSIPSNTEVEMTTIKSYGSLRTTRMPISELRPIKARFGIENLARVPRSLERTSINPKRPWWAPKEQILFFVGNERRKSVETAVWQKALEQIRSSANLPVKVKLS